MKKIIPALAMLLISAIVMSTASFAWFSQNQKVTTSGMKVTAKASGALIISETNTAADFTGSTAVEYKKAAAKLLPSTLATALSADAEGNTWQYADSTTENAVDANTGKGGVMTEIDANSSTTAYYIDYTSYVAAAGEALTDSKLYAEITWPTINGTLPTGKAVSVAFYVQKVNVQQNVGVVSSTDDGGTENFLYGQLDVNPTDITPVIAQQSGTNANADNKWQIYGLEGGIPSATEGTPAVLAITMRVYFDGALEDANKAGSTYIRSSEVDDSAFALEVAFVAE